ncbi:GspMb/PilO family protein [Aromatoleum aromaticum]|uniref:Transmembrane protein n=1 Tax=Aromatoleum aromaticum (strain DSM 19018 / LMG 30748 / EbN1) TaxID=76114 RepID=Q5P7D2_AROAE|nr:GspMb/PilO family protein [Aromatoleum aromaticum]NMG53684.1 hypothetical protein [Aromatoleum aromaticum]CAI06779.1 hypothetical protein ebA1234 [Aromatoleum aromaticum EbN1]
MRHGARIQEAVLRAILHAGWAGAFGASLLAFALAFGFSGDAEIGAQRDTLAEERARLLRPARPAAGATSDPRSRIDRYYAVFPVRAALPARLDRLHAVAEAQGIEIESAAYDTADVPDTPLERISLTLPVRGDFTRVYAWLAEALREIPELTLEALSVKRAAADSTEVEGEARFVLFVRSDR